MARKNIVASAEEKRAAVAVITTYIAGHDFRDLIETVRSTGIAKRGSLYQFTVVRTPNGEVRVESSNELLVAAVRRTCPNVTAVHVNRPRKAR